MKVEDPLFIWLRGEPGCSASEFIFDKSGPYTYQKSDKDQVADVLLKNDISWNNFANILVIDLPIGTGYSFPLNSESLIFEDKDKRTGGRIQMMTDFIHFMKKFYVLHPQYKERELYIGGIDFTAGKIMPIIVQAI